MMAKRFMGLFVLFIFLFSNVAVAYDFSDQFGKQFKAPQQYNPFGDEQLPSGYNDSSKSDKKVTKKAKKKSAKSKKTKKPRRRSKEGQAKKKAQEAKKKAAKKKAGKEKEKSKKEEEKKLEKKTEEKTDNDKKEKESEDSSTITTLSYIEYDGSNDAPKITYLEVDNDLLVDKSFMLKVTAEDDHGVAAIEVLKQDGERIRKECPEQEGGIFRFAAECEHQFELLEVRPGLYAYRVFAFDEQGNQFMDFVDAHVADRDLLFITQVEYEGNDLDERGPALAIETETDATVSVKYENIGESVLILGGAVVSIDNNELGEEDFAIQATSRERENIEIDVPALAPGQHTLTVALNGEGNNNIQYTDSKVFPLVVPEPRPDPEPEPEPELGDLEITQATITQNGAENLVGDPFMVGSPVVVDDISFVNNGPGDIAGRVRFGFSLTNEAGRIIQEGGATRAIVVDAEDSDTARLGGPFTFNDLEVGRYALEITIDSRNDIDETNEDNNVRVFEFEVAEEEIEPDVEERGDLEILELTVTQNGEEEGPFVTGTEILIEDLMFINNGPGNIANRGRISYSLAAEDGEPFREISTERAIIADAGEGDILNLQPQFTFSSNQPGRFTLTLKIDIEDSIDETNENNNDYVYEFNVVEPEPEAIDISIVVPAPLNDNNLVVGDALDFELNMLRLQGRPHARLCNQHVLNILPINDLPMAEPVERECHEEVRDIPAEEIINQYHVEFDRAGEYTLDVEIWLEDENGEKLDEVREDNNELQFVWQIPEPAPEPEPTGDLEIDELHVHSPDQVARHGPFVAGNEIQLRDIYFINNGPENIAADVAFSMRVVDENGNVVIEEATRNHAIAVDAGEDEEFDLDRFGGEAYTFVMAEPGNYTLEVIIDSNDDVLEHDEDNNLYKHELDILAQEDACPVWTETALRQVGGINSQIRTTAHELADAEIALMEAVDNNAPPNEIFRLREEVDDLEQELDELTDEELDDVHDDFRDIYEVCGLAPDLVITDVRVVTDSLDVGLEQIELDVDIQNQGNYAVYGPFGTELNYDPGAFVRRAVLSTHVRDNRELAVGELVTFRTRISSQEILDNAGVYDLNIEVDECDVCESHLWHNINNNILESNEDNNEFEFQIEIGDPEAQCDVQIDQLRRAAGDARDGLVLAGRARNDASIDLWQARDAGAPAEEIAELEEQLAEAQEEVNRAIQAVRDANDVLVEEQAACNNNEHPDLIIVGAEFTPHPINAGERYEFEVTYQNIGDAPFYGTYVGIEAGTNERQDGPRGRFNVATAARPDGRAIQPGETETYSFVRDDDRSQLNNPGVYDYFVMIDQCDDHCGSEFLNQWVVESNENNNVWNGQYEIVDEALQCEEEIDNLRRAVGDARDVLHTAYWAATSADWAWRRARDNGEDQEELDRLEEELVRTAEEMVAAEEALEQAAEDLAALQDECGIHEHPDLVITDVRFIPHPVVLGQAYEFEVDIQNIGEAPVYGDGIAVQGRAPDDANPRTGFNFGSRALLPNGHLPAGNTVTMRIETSSRNNYFRRADTYAFDVVVDECLHFCDNPAIGTVAESNEDNNVFNAQVTTVTDGIDVTLENYPRYLINVDDEQTYVVVGENSPASDTIGATDIRVQLVNDICDDDDACAENAAVELVPLKLDSEVWGFGSENQIMIGDICENTMFGKIDPSFREDCENNPIQTAEELYQEMGLEDGMARIWIHPHFHRASVHIGITGPDVQCRREAARILANYEDNVDILQGQEAIIDCRIEEVPEPFDLELAEIPDADPADVVLNNTIEVEVPMFIEGGIAHGRLCARESNSFNPLEGNNGGGSAETECEEEIRDIPIEHTFGPYEIDFNAPGQHTFTLEAWVEDEDGNRLAEINEDNNEVTKSWVVEGEPGYYHVVFESSFWTQHLFDIRDGSSTPIVSAINNVPRYLTWHPDGDEFAYAWSRVNEPVYKARLDENNEVPNNAVEIVTQGMRQYTELQWSPDGTKVAFSANIGDRDFADYHVFIMDADGGNVINVTENIEGLQNMHGPFYDPVWSPDGSLLAFTPEVLADDGVNTDWEVFVVQADGEGLQRLTNRVHATKRFPSFTADGQHVIYVSLWPDNALYKVDINGENNDPLFGEQGYESIAGLEVSPNGEHVAFVAQRVNEDTYGLYLADPEGGQQPVYLNDVESGKISWSPDSSQIAVLVENPDNARRDAAALMDLNGNIRILSDNADESYHNPVWRPKMVV